MEYFSLKRRSERYLNEKKTIPEHRKCEKRLKEHFNCVHTSHAKNGDGRKWSGLKEHPRIGCIRIEVYSEVQLH